MWYAYRLDVLDSNGRPTVIAPGCTGEKLADKSCTFKEFVSYIRDMTKPLNKNWDLNSLQDSTDLKTDADTLAKNLRASGYQNVHDPAKLAAEPYKNNFETEMGRIVDRLQACRVSLGDGKVQFELDESRKAMVTVLQARKADQAGAVIAGMKEKFLSYNLDPSDLKLKTTQYTGRADLHSWEEPDIQSTYVEVANNPGRGQRLTDAMKDFASDFGTPRDKTAGKSAKNQNISHQKAIQLSQAYQSRLHGAPGC